MAIHIAAASRAMVARLALVLRVTSRSSHSQEPHEHPTGISQASVAPLASKISSQCPYEKMMEAHRAIISENPTTMVPPHHVDEIADHLLCHQIQDRPSDKELLHIYRGWVLTVTH
ncbi:hypothetical protein O3P69_003153 [Scylla paramamosain]|uniref:Uncharacterized protein n=1 Tax=Scylla paramamosain TaxID=85552 RepID=A0AAW0UPY1_SCYPA